MRHRSGFWWSLYPWTCGGSDCGVSVNWLHLRISNLYVFCKLPPKVSGKWNHRWPCLVIKTCNHMLHFSAAAHARRGPRGGHGGHMQGSQWSSVTPSLPMPDLNVLWLLGNMQRCLQIRALSRSLLRWFLATFLLTCFTQAYIQSECAAQLSYTNVHRRYAHHKLRDAIRALE